MKQNAATIREGAGKAGAFARYFRLRRAYGHAAFDSYALERT